jgi:RNA polymerase sigma factor (sigma-70 family)
VALFRAGHDEAFRVIHDRYRQRLFAYARQMLPGRQDAEDALQDVFVRAYSNLRANDRELALRAWLYRVAHNRCIDELRRPAPPPPEAMVFICSPIQDPIAQADQRDSLRRLVDDIRRLPPQQRSALLMRELGGMPYADLAEALGVSVPAVKSLLVRARMSLAQAVEARETACADIREELIVAHDRRTRPSANARRHLRDCPGCRQFRAEMRGMSRQLAALVPALGPLGVAAKLLGLGGGASGGAAAGGSAAAVSGAAGSGGAAVSAGALATGAGHVATLIAATVVTAGGAVEIQRTITQPPAVHHHHAHRVRAAASPSTAGLTQATAVDDSAPVPVTAPAPAPPVPAAASVSSSSASVATPAPLKVITGKAVKKVSSAVSTTTKHVKSEIKGTTASEKSSSSTHIADASTAAGSSSTTSDGSATGGSTTGTPVAASAGSTGPATPSETTSPSAAGPTSAGAAGAPGSAATGSPAAGSSVTGSGTS